MTPQRIRCPHCQQASGVDPTLLGGQVRCPHCQRPFVAVVESPASSVPPAPIPAPSHQTFACPGCERRFQVPVDRRILQVACPHCQQSVGIDWGAVPGMSPVQVDDLSAGRFPLQTPLETPIKEDPESIRISVDPHRQPSASKREGAAFVIPTEDGGEVRLHEPVKTMVKRGQIVELRKLSPEERSRRRRIWNLVMFAFGTLFLLGLAFLLRWLVGQS